MYWRDIRPGKIVYHGVFTHWGPGTILSVVSATHFETLFERKGPKRILVKWAGTKGAVRMQLCELRKTPNRAKIKQMVALYCARGVKAEDGGDRLILPTTEVE